ncbi:hypothetical protein H8B06_08100 [Sphingobacterium sp. DN00404]|uniref:DUF1574 domain-containing protein n=1 Tax=Sphingobacterium micropteri TaxID=2763501 RepID=A0ABR7YNI8_9SPHI|nr:hypothetical protein [Sphingobacterium micropteri]MBD1432781.1 hypothetical protein [Sphingobacterium micropteri]
MKKFLVRTFFFFFPFVVISYPLDYGISYFLSKSNDASGEFEVWSDIYSSKVNCDIAIYGSSRAWVHIDPQIIADSLNQSVYNFGINGHNFWLQYLRHLELEKHNKSPKVIVLSVDVFSLQKREDLYNPDQFLPYMLWNSNIANFTKSYKGYNGTDYYIPLIRYAGKFEALKSSIKHAVMNTSDIHYRTNGFKGMDREWNTDLEKAKSNNVSYEIELDNKSIELFELFIQECDANHTDLILVYTPEYIDGQNYVSNRKDVIDIYKNLAVKYQLTFLDYSNDSICLNKQLFYNASHLNKKGACVFSKKLAKDIKYERIMTQL